MCVVVGGGVHGPPKQGICTCTHAHRCAATHPSCPPVQVADRASEGWESWMRSAWRRWYT